MKQPRNSTPPSGNQFELLNSQEEQTQTDDEASIAHDSEKDVEYDGDEFFNSPEEEEPLESQPELPRLPPTPAYLFRRGGLQLPGQHTAHNQQTRLSTPPTRLHPTPARSKTTKITPQESRTLPLTPRTNPQRLNQILAPALPSATTTIEELPIQMYTYRAQLTFELTPTSTEVNVAQHFRRWLYSSQESIGQFSLLPFDDEKGQQIHSVNQVPDDNADFYKEYYHNHRVLQHGNLTGMVAFQTSTPWSQIKNPNHPFFRWLRFNKVYLNHTKFKTSTLVPCGFLLGAHPGYFRRDEAERELTASLQLTPDQEVQFQLSSRSISVPIQDGKPDRYTIQAVIVETSTKHAAILREKFFSLAVPELLQQQFPYTGRYPLIPLIKTKEWTVNKIFSLAKLHVKMMQDLKAIFLTNLQDIQTVIDQDGTTLMQGFYGMQFPTTLPSQKTPEPLIHSIHNTGSKTTKVVLVTTAHYEEALTQLSAIHSILTSSIPQEYHTRVFINSLQVTITGQQIDSISSCNSAAYATTLLMKYNPQDGTEDEDIQPPKRYKPVPLTYADAISHNIDASTTAVPTPTHLPSITQTDLDNLYDQMKQFVSDHSHGGIQTAELEDKISRSTQEIQSVRDQLQHTIQGISTKVTTLANDMVTQTAKLSEEIQRQNVIILGMQRQFQESFSDFAHKLQELYQDRQLPPTNLNPSQVAATSKPRPWGSPEK
jgi:hypothetical protein